MKTSEKNEVRNEEARLRRTLRRGGYALHKSGPFYSIVDTGPNYLVAGDPWKLRLQEVRDWVRAMGRPIR